MTALPIFIGAGTAVVGTAGINARIDVPGAVPGDLLLLAIQSSNQACSTPTGWTEAPSSPQGTGTAASAGATRLTLFYRRADKDTCTASATVAVADTGDHTLGICYAFRGTFEGTFWDTSSGGTEANNDTSLSATGGTTTTANCLIVAFIVNSIDGLTTDQLSSPTNTDLSDVTSRQGANVPQTASGTGGGINLITGGKAAAGAFGATTGTFANNSNYGFVTLALKPAVTPWLVAAGTAVASSTDRTVPWPAGHQADDIGLLFVETSGGEPVSPPSGWSTMANSPQATGAGIDGTQLTVYYRRATSGAESTPTITDAGDHIVAVMHVFRNCIANGSPIDVTSGGVKAGASTSVTIGGATTATDNCLVVAVATRDNDLATAEFSAWSNANLTNPLEMFDAGGTSGNGGGFGILRGVLPTAGATADTSATTATSVVNAFMTIALLPPAAAAGAAARFYVVIVG